MNEFSGSQQKSTLLSFFYSGETLDIKTPLKWTDGNLKSWLRVYRLRPPLKLRLRPLPKLRLEPPAGRGLNVEPLDGRRVLLPNPAPVERVRSTLFRLLFALGLSELFNLPVVRNVVRLTTAGGGLL